MNEGLKMVVDILGYSGSMQTQDSSNTSLLITSASTSILVDTSGSPAQALLQRNFNPDLLDAIVLTHAHVDHLYALPSLLHNLWMRKRQKELLIVGNPETLEAAKQLYQFFHLDRKPSLDSIICWADACKQVGDIEIETFSLYHRPQMTTQGYTFFDGTAKVAYFPDSVVQKPYPDCAENSQLLIHEVGGLDVDRQALHYDGHSSALEVAQLAKTLNAQALLLVHLPPSEAIHSAIFEEASGVFPAVRMPMECSSIIVS